MLREIRKGESVIEIVKRFSQVDGNVIKTPKELKEVFKDYPTQEF